MKAAGFLPAGTRLDNPDFAEMAKAIGIYGVRIQDPGYLQGGLEAAFKHPGPAIIDVLTDPLELVMPPKVTLEQAKGFSVWMMKAVLNGQGNELVRLALSAWER
jgi:pyruvate dehydrogenase (quinone)